ncbi:hypothetical protein CUMW_146130 [Citrus unshiu]|nr:hypothetical protein CUMW_146130 [Citrus unshiu]
MTTSGLSCRSIAQIKSPGDGSSKLFHDVTRRSRPVSKSHPSFIPGSNEARRVIDQVESVRNPNHCFNWDIFVPNSYVTILGTTRAEETKLEASIF